MRLFWMTKNLKQSIKSIITGIDMDWHKNASIKYWCCNENNDIIFVRAI